MPHGKSAKLARFVAKRAKRGKTTVAPTKGKKQTREDNNKTKKNQQDWVGSDEWSLTNKVLIMMESQGVTNPKHVLEIISRFKQMEQQLKAHLQDQECK